VERDYTIYAVDFDGTITIKSKYPEIGELNEKVADWIRKKHKNGDMIIIWTCRGGKELQEAIDFLKANNVPFDYVNGNPTNSFGDDTRKIYADYYIDDRAINVLDIDLPDNYNEQLLVDLSYLMGLVFATSPNSFILAKVDAIADRYGITDVMRYSNGGNKI
jgi:hydroxymethylpyrimidine pyrophosphatase-like HAD family hydrolase